MAIAWNEISEKSNGGTELIARRLERSMQNAIPEIFEKFQIIPSRVRKLDPDKYRILWVHDLPDDPESKHLANNGWTKFHRIVFVSYWQRQSYIMRYGIPYYKTAVIRNAVDLVEWFDVYNKFKSPDKIKLIYTSTPQRGLDVLVSVFKKLCEEFPDRLHLDVYSSFKIYGWDDPKDAKVLFDEINAHPNMTHHGVIPNNDLRAKLTESHIFAYPSTWPETSCMALMEAMMAGCVCVHSDLAVLPETSVGLTTMYPYTEGSVEHSEIFKTYLRTRINEINKNTLFTTHICEAMDYAMTHYSWTRAQKEWRALLTQIAENETPQQPAGSAVKGQFIYKT